MSRLTEIMKQIPLDELMGETEITEKNKEQNKETTGGIIMNNEEMRSNINHTGAYAKRTGAFVSAAAIALVAIGGAFAYSKFSKNSPEASDINTSTPSSQLPSTSSVPDDQSTVQPSTSETSAANQAILGEYILSKPELKEGYNDRGSMDYFEVDANCGYALYRGGERVDRKVTLFKVSNGKVTEYTELKGMDGATYELPYNILQTQIFEMGGSKYAALLVEIINEHYYPVVTILNIDGDDPLVTGVRYYEVNMAKFCDQDLMNDPHADPKKYPTRYMSLKDVFTVKDNTVNVDGIDYRVNDRDLVPEFRKILEDYINNKTNFPEPEISQAYTYTNKDRYAYGAYYDHNKHISVICKASGQTVVEYADNLLTGNSTKQITGRVYDMCSFFIGDKEHLAILADNCTNGGVAPMIIVLDISSESPVAVMSSPAMINMLHYDSDAQTIDDNGTVIYVTSKFDENLSTYMQSTENGFKIDDRTFTLIDGKILEAQ